MIKLNKPKGHKRIEIRFYEYFGSKKGKIGSNISVYETDLKEVRNIVLEALSERHLKMNNLKRFLISQKQIGKKMVNRSKEKSEEFYGYGFIDATAEIEKRLGISHEEKK